MLTITLVDGKWEIRDADGQTLGATHDTYDAALAAMADLLGDLATLAADDQDGDDAEQGLLPERWTDVAGICFSAPTGDGRDFTDCTWSWRDPDVSLLPLMLQTENAPAHMAAVLAGYMETVEMGDGRVHASGRFYDSEAGREFRDMLQGGRRFGVSVDPGPGTELEWQCLEEDEDGWCIESKIDFSAYEIIGLTGTPFPGFAEAAITLAAETASTRHAPVDLRATGAKAGAPVEPRPEALAVPEPELGDDRLVEQDDDGNVAVPMTITDDLEVYGHLAYWGQCHTGYDGVCVAPPASPSGYAQFHLGETLCSDRSRVATGAFVVGCDHADLAMFAAEARDHYAHSGLRWASVRVVDGQFGPWFSGSLLPSVTEEQLSIIRASCPSGDWRRLGGALELIMGLQVNNPGFPIRREALVASGLTALPVAHAAQRMKGGVPQALVASRIVRPAECGTCDGDRPIQTRKLATATMPLPGNADQLGRIEDLLVKLERRTRPLATQAAADARAQLTR